MNKLDIDAGTASRAWFDVKTQPRREGLAEARLERQGFVTYLPKIKVTVCRDEVMKVAG